MPSIPIYTNRNLILDLASFLVEGYLESKSIKSVKEQEDTLRIALDYKEQGTTKDKSTTDTSEKSGYINVESEISDEITIKKVYTTFYFFNNIKDILRKKKLVRDITEYDIINKNICCGEYIEFSAKISTTSTLGAINRIIDVLESYDIKVLDSLIKDNIGGLTNCSVILKQLKNINGYLSKNSTTDLIMNFNSARAVLDININNFCDKNACIYDTAYSECKTLCKIIKTVDENSSIDLLRKTGISDYCCDFFNSIKPYLKVLSDKGILVPNNFITKINGPAIQVIPIAIYV